MEALTGNADRARKLYDAALVVDGTHACAWHKWGMLEKSQGNFTRARDLWMQVGACDGAVHRKEAEVRAACATGLLGRQGGRSEARCCDLNCYLPCVMPMLVYGNEVSIVIVAATVATSVPHSTGVSVH